MGGNNSSLFISTYDDTPKTPTTARIAAAIALRLTQGEFCGADSNRPGFTGESESTAHGSAEPPDPPEFANRASVDERSPRRRCPDVGHV